jgi:hypothetical protein
VYQKELEKLSERLDEAMSAIVCLQLRYGKITSVQPLREYLEEEREREKEQEQ